jgi:hypothetical protein
LQTQYFSQNLVAPEVESGTSDHSTTSIRFQRCKGLLRILPRLTCSKTNGPAPSFLLVWRTGVGHVASSLEAENVTPVLPAPHPENTSHQQMRDCLAVCPRGAPHAKAVGLLIFEYTATWTTAQQTQGERAFRRLDQESPCWRERQQSNLPVINPVGPWTSDSAGEAQQRFTVSGAARIKNCSVLWMNCFP